MFVSIWNYKHLTIDEKCDRFTFIVYKNAVFDTNRKSLLQHLSAEKGLK